MAVFSESVSDREKMEKISQKQGLNKRFSDGKAEWKDILPCQKGHRCRGCGTVRRRWGREIPAERGDLPGRGWDTKVPL